MKHYRSNCWIEMARCTRSMPIIFNTRNTHTHTYTSLFAFALLPICNRVNQIFFVPCSHFCRLFVQSSSSTLLMLVTNSATLLIIIFSHTKNCGADQNSRQRERVRRKLRSNSVPRDGGTHTSTLSDSPVFVHC